MMRRAGNDSVIGKALSDFGTTTRPTRICAGWSPMRVLRLPGGGGGGYLERGFGERCGGYG